MNFFTNFFVAAVLAGTPLLFGILGEIINEKSGHLNLGVEGMMSIGACAGFMMGYKTDNLLLALIAAFAAGMLGALIYAVLTVTFMADQNVTGLTLTIFGIGLSNFFGDFVREKSGATSLKLPSGILDSLGKVEIPLLSDIPVLGKLFFNYNIFVYLGIVAAILCGIYLHRTKAGLNIRAVGENPAAADAAGLPVTRLKYINLMLGGGICGIGGGKMSTKSELLKLLESHRGEYLSGEELASRLGYSRTAVWKAMKSLRQEGYRILAVNNRGYALETDNDILSVEAVKMHLEHRNVFMQVEKEISSTNQYLKKKGIEENLSHGSFVAAEAQTEGKGRRGRTFYSPAGSGLYLSVLMRPKRTAQEGLTLTAAAAVAVCRAVEEVCGVSLGIKWVNDLYLGERKVCGILTEAVTDFETGDIELVVVGIGLNLRMPAGGFPGELSEVAGAILGDDVYVDRNLLTAGIINYLLEEAEKEGIPEAYISRNIVPGRRVRVAYGTRVRSVEAEKILPDGRLLVKNEQGEEEILPCGDVSLNLH